MAKQTGSNIRVCRLQPGWKHVIIFLEVDFHLGTNSFISYYQVNLMITFTLGPLVQRHGLFFRKSAEFRCFPLTMTSSLHFIWLPVIIFCCIIRAYSMYCGLVKMFSRAAFKRLPISKVLQLNSIISIQVYGGLVSSHRTYKLQYNYLSYFACVCDSTTFLLTLYPLHQCHVYPTF